LRKICQKVIFPLDTVTQPWYNNNFIDIAPKP
jgi:hypothetical protein